MLSSADVLIGIYLSLFSKEVTLHNLELFFLIKHSMHLPSAFNTVALETLSNLIWASFLKL